MKAGICVLADAPGKMRVVVPPVVEPANQVLERRLHILQQRALKFVDEHRGGGVQRLHQQHTGLQPVLLENLIEMTGDAD